MPLFWTSGDVSSRFQSQSAQPLFVLDRGVCDVHCLRFTSGATPTDLLTSKIVASHCSPYACFSRGRVLDLNGRPPT